MRPSGSPQELEHRRQRAITLLADGLLPGEVATRVGVDRRSVRRWKAAYQRRGAAGIRATPATGRPPKLLPAQQRRVVTLLLKGAQAAGYATDLWTCPRVAAVIWQQFRVRYHVDHIGRLLRTLGWSPQQPRRRAVERDEAAIQQWVTKTWPRVKKNAARRGATLVFLDEAGFLMAPVARRTWAPRGQTPVLTQRTRAHQKVSAIAAVVIPPRRDRVRCFFRLAPDANFDGQRIVAFLQHLRRTLRGPLTLIWDRLQAHRGEIMKTYLRRARHLEVHLLPPYAPELNPVELIWGHAKHNGMANFAPVLLTELTQRSRATTRSIARSQRLRRSFLKHSPLSLRLK